MADKKEKFEPFDFYFTGIRSNYWDSFVWKNSDEDLLKLSDYGITKQEVYEYTQLIDEQREEAAKRQKIYDHRSNFFKVLAALFSIWFFFFVVGYFNDFMKEYGILFDILCYPVYIGLGIISYGIYMGFAFVIESIQEKIELAYRYPNNGRPKGYDPRIEKYFSDLLWKLKDHL